MPSKNSKNWPSDNYQLFLDQLEEILITYNSTHAVFILGDINASLVHRKGNIQDSLLVNFVETNSLFYQQDGIETFFHPNKTYKAEIDYVLYNKNGNDLIMEVSVAREVALNTSDHVPVLGVLKTRTKDVPRQNLQITCKPKWDKCDRSAYRRCFSYVCSVCACLDLSVSSSSWGLGRAAVCDCGTPWTFLLPFL